MPETRDQIFKPIRGEVVTLESILSFVGWIHEYLLPNPDEILENEGIGLEGYQNLLIDACVESAFEYRKSVLKKQEWGLFSKEANVEKMQLAKRIMKFLNPYKLIEEGYDGIFYGFKPFEIVSVMTDPYLRKLTNFQPGALIIPELKGKMPYYFHFNIHRDLMFNRLFGPDFFGEKMDPRKWVVFTHRERHDNPYGRGIAQSIYWWVQFKRVDIRAWVQLVDKYGTPIPVGKYPRGATTEDKEEMLADLMNVFTKAAIIYREGGEIDVKSYGDREAEMYQGLLNYCDYSIDRVILGSDAATSRTPTGTYGGRKVGSDMASEKADADRRDMAEWICQQQVNLIYQYNWPEETVIPDFRWYEEDDVKKELADRDTQFLQTGKIKFTREYYKEKYGLEDGHFELIDEPQEKPPLPLGFGNNANGQRKNQNVDRGDKQFSSPEVLTALDSLAGVPPEAIELVDKVFSMVEKSVHTRDDIKKALDTLTSLFPKINSDEIKSALESRVFLAGIIANQE